MLTARPTRLGSWSFVVEDDEGRAVAEVDLSHWKDQGTLRLGDVPFAFAKKGWLSRTVTLAFEGVEVARAERRGALGIRYEVRIEAGLLGIDTPLNLTLVSSATRRVNWVLVGEREVGEIRRRGVFKREAEIVVSDALPLGVQAFLLALVVIEWRRAARSSA